MSHHGSANSPCHGVRSQLCVVRLSHLLLRGVQVNFKTEQIIVWGCLILAIVLCTVGGFLAFVENAGIPAVYCYLIGFVLMVTACVMSE